MTDNQRTSLAQKIAQIEAETQAKIVALRMEAEKAALKELSTEQRQRAAEALGDYYNYAPVSTAERFQKRLSDKEAKEGK